jgi:ABC-type proline/glycine betaine transport system permease subunit
MIASKCTFNLCLLSILQAMIPFSVSVAYLIGFIVNVILYSNNKFHNPYYLFFSFPGAIPCLLLLFGLLFIPEFPRWLVSAIQKSVGIYMVLTWCIKRQKKKTVNSNSYLVLSKGMLSFNKVIK